MFNKANKCKQASSPTKCKKVKNPCKICFETVSAKNGVQCLGACRKWAHYKCLGYAPGKIQDIKNRYIQIICPCPGCDTPSAKKEKQLINVPHFCGKSGCPASGKPICETLVCPKHYVIPGSSRHSCPRDCASDTGVTCPLPCEKSEKVCALEKSLQTCDSLLKDKSLQSCSLAGDVSKKSRCTSIQKSVELKCTPAEESLPKCCREGKLSSECRFLDSYKRARKRKRSGHKRFPVQDVSPDCKKIERERSPGEGHTFTQKRLVGCNTSKADNRSPQRPKPSLEVFTECHQDKPESSSNKSLVHKAKLKKINESPTDDETAPKPPLKACSLNSSASSGSIIVFSGRNAKKVMKNYLNTASLIRRILNTKDIQYPSVHKMVTHTAGLEFSQNMPSNIDSEGRLLHENCSLEKIGEAMKSNITKSILVSSNYSATSGKSVELKAIKLCKSDSCLVDSPSQSHNTLTNAIGHIYGAVGNFHKQIREFMGKITNVVFS